MRDLNLNGVKIRKVINSINIRTYDTRTLTIDYLDGFQYESGVKIEYMMLPGGPSYPILGDDTPPSANPNTPGQREVPYTDLLFVPTSEGYYDFRKKAYIYNYVDHLGNVRLSYRKNSAGVLEILEENNYYPFGLTHEGYNKLTGNSDYNYKYNGKELQETGMYDYGARMYMPDIGRWGVVDPLAEKYPSISPYAYVANNPINAIDPDGRYILFVTNTGVQLQYRKGSFYFMNGNLKGQKYDGRRHFTGSYSLFSLARAYRKIENSNDKVLKDILHQLENSENVHKIQDGTAGRGSHVYTNRKGSAKDYQGDGSITFYDFSQESKKSFEEIDGVKNSDLSIVTHEMSHQLDEDMGNTADDQYPDTASDPSEIRAVNIENRGRKLDKLPARTKYGGEKIDLKKLENPPNQKLPK